MLPISSYTDCPAMLYPFNYFMTSSDRNGKKSDFIFMHISVILKIDLLPPPSNCCQHFL